MKRSLSASFQSFLSLKAKKKDLGVYKAVSYIYLYNSTFISIPPCYIYLVLFLYNTFVNANIKSLYLDSILQNCSSGLGKEKVRIALSVFIMTSSMLILSPFYSSNVGIAAIYLIFW